MVTVVVAVVTARSVAEVTRLRWAVMVLVVKVRAAAAVAEVVAMTVAARVEVAVIVGQVAMRIAVVATVRHFNEMNQWRRLDIGNSQ